MQYQKLLLNITRLLKVLSVCSLNKPNLVSLNIMQLLSNHLLKPAQANSQQLPAAPAPVTSSTTAADIIQNCLITLRNLSDAATLETNMLIPAKHLLIEPLSCALRHITNRHAVMLMAQSQFRAAAGIPILTQLMVMQPRMWSCIKAALGLVRNICSNPANANDLRSNCIIEKLMQILYDAYTELQTRISAQPALAAATSIKHDDVNMFDIVDASATALLLLAKEYANQLIMKDLDCIGFFVQMFYSSNVLIQKAAASLLAELAASKDCSEVIEQQPGVQHFITTTFCNQYGQLKSVEEMAASVPPAATVPISSSGHSHVSTILQHVNTLMHRTQEHRNQRAFFIQQQQMQQQQRQQQYMYQPGQHQANLPPPPQPMQQPQQVVMQDPYMQQQPVYTSMQPQQQQYFAPQQQQQQLTNGNSVHQAFF